MKFLQVTYTPRTTPPRVSLAAAGIVKERRVIREYDEAVNWLQNFIANPL